VTDIDMRMFARNAGTIDMRTFARRAGANVSYAVGLNRFQQG
jgi:hypothetical protein